MATAVDAREVGLLTKEQFSSINIEDFLFKSTDNLFTKEELEYFARPSGDPNW